MEGEWLKSVGQVLKYFTAWGITFEIPNCKKKH